VTLDEIGFYITFRRCVANCSANSPEIGIAMNGGMYDMQLIDIASTVASKQ